MFKRLLRALLRFFLLALLCWVCVIAYWAYVERMPSTGDVVLYLVLLPVGLLLGWWVLKWLWRGLKWVVRRWQAAPSLAAFVQPTSATDAIPVAPPQPQWWVLGTSVLTPVGVSPAEITEMVRSAQLPAALSEDLVNGDGMPVREARIASLAIGKDEWAGQPLQRLLSLLYAVWLEQRPLLEQAAQAFLAVRARRELARQPAQVVLHPAWQGQPHAAVAEHKGDERVAEAVSVHLVLPDSLGVAELKFLREEVRLWLLDCGWPEDVVLVDVRGCDEGSQPLLDIDQALGKPENVLLVLLGAASYLHQEWVDAAAAAGLLMHPGRQTAGVFPGEGGACLVLAHSALWGAGGAPLAPPLARLTRVAALARSTPVTTPGRVEANALCELAASLGGLLKFDWKQLGAVVSNADYQPTRLIEMGDWMMRSAGHLDCVDDVLYVGQACGYCGPASTLIALALQVHAVELKQVPVALVANAHVLQRGMVLALPVGFVLAVDQNETGGV